MSQQSVEEILLDAIWLSKQAVEGHQRLIDKWNDPEDIAQRAAVLIRDVYSYYGQTSSIVYEMLKTQKKKKNPAKKRSVKK